MLRIDMIYKQNITIRIVRTIKKMMKKMMKKIICNLFKILFTNKVKHTFAPNQILYICTLRW